MIKTRLTEKQKQQIKRARRDAANLAEADMRKEFERVARRKRELRSPRSIHEVAETLNWESCFAPYSLGLGGFDHSGRD